MESITTVKLNLQHPNTIPIVYAKQGDKFTRKIKAYLFDGETPWTPPNNSYKLVRCMKPDRTSVVYDKLEDNITSAVVVNGSSATICLRQQALAAAGDVYLEVNFYTTSGGSSSGSKLQELTTFSIIVKVEKSAVDNVALESSDEFDILSDKIEQVLAAEGALANIEVSAISNYTAQTPSVSVVRTGADNHYKFNFGLPRGSTGAAASVLSRVASYYQDSVLFAPSTIASASWSSTFPTPSPEHYIYTRNTDEYNNGEFIHSYTVVRNGKNGTGAVDSVNGHDGNVLITPSSIGAATTTDLTNLETSLTSAIQTAISTYLPTLIQIGTCAYTVAKSNTPNTYWVSVPLTIPSHLQGSYMIGGVIGVSLNGSTPAAILTEVVTTGNNPHAVVYTCATYNSGQLPFDAYGCTITVWVMYIRTNYTTPAASSSSSENEEEPEEP